MPSPISHASPRCRRSASWPLYRYTLPDGHSLWHNLIEFIVHNCNHILIPISFFVESAVNLACGSRIPSAVDYQFRFQRGKVAIMSNGTTLSTTTRLGVITDIQYANKPDSEIFYLSKVRYYSTALQKLSDAVAQINKRDVAATLHLGDIIDGNESIDLDKADLESVKNGLEKLEKPVWHVFGNHCLSVGKQYLLDSLKMKRGYYARDLPGWTVIVIDTVDISVHSHLEENQRLAKEFMETHKDADNANDWNGGLSETQLTWLREELDSAKNAGRNVLVCGHIPMFCTNTTKHVIYHYEELHKLFVEKGVKAYFAGHYHDGDYVRKDGIHYVTFESIIDSSEKGSWGIIELCQDCIVVEGHGDMTPRRLEF